VLLQEIAQLEKDSDDLFYLQVEIDDINRLLDEYGIPREEKGHPLGTIHRIRLLFNSKSSEKMP